MSDPGTNPNPEGGAPAAEGGRPDWLPETYFDADAKTVKADALKADLDELPALRELKTAQETRAASLPKDPSEYKVELPEGFKIPDGLKFTPPDDKDPMVAMARKIAQANGLDQKQFAGMVAEYAQLTLDSEKAAIEADKAYVAEQNKLLGEKATERRDAIKRFGAAHLTKDQNDALGVILDGKIYVELFESLISNINGTTTRGNPDNNADDTKTELAGTPGGGRKLLDAANTRKN